MLTRALSDMRDAVQRTADVVAFTDKHPIARVNDLINQGLGALSRVCRTTNPEFQPVASTTLTTDGFATLFGLPALYRSLLSVEYTADGCKEWLEPYNTNERATLTSPIVNSSATRARYYKIIGNNIELLPKPVANHTVLLWYATTVTQLASDPATADVMDRLDSYVIWWAAREIAGEREAWERYDRLSQRIAELEGDIRILARSIDLSAPARPVDARLAPTRRTDRFGRGAGWRR